MLTTKLLFFENPQCLEMELSLAIDLFYTAA